MQLLFWSGDTESTYGVCALYYGGNDADLSGNTWEQAKTQAECLDYLFEIAVKMLLAKIPLEGDA
jgi:hypothetical protein